MKAFKTKQECQLFKDKIGIIYSFFEQHKFGLTNRPDDCNVDTEFFEKDNIIAKWRGFREDDYSLDDNIDFMKHEEYTHEDLFDALEYGPFTFNIEIQTEDCEEYRGALFNVYSITRQDLIDELRDIKTEFNL